MCLHQAKLQNYMYVHEYNNFFNKPKFIRKHISYAVFLFILAAAVALHRTNILFFFVKTMHEFALHQGSKNQFFLKKL